MQPKKQSRNAAKTGGIPTRWYKAILERRTEQEKLRVHVLVQINMALKTLAKKYHWDEAYLFGSVVQKGKFRRNSDIDIALAGLNSLEHYAFTGDISEILNMSVDVILLEECAFTKSVKEKGIKWNRKTGF